MNLEPHEPDVDGFGYCRECWLEADDTHDEQVAAAKARLEKALAASAGEFHLRPGPHPSGSPQSVRGAKRGGRLLREARNKGRFTYQPILRNSPREGFAVSPYPQHTQILEASKVTAKHINDYTAKHREFIKSDPRHHLGGWRDDETGLFYLDIAIVEDTRAGAKAVAERYGERAFYDLSAPGGDGTIRTEDA